MVQSTKGPWERNDRQRIGHRRDIFGGGRHLATVHTAFGVWDTNEANATLIAAAPDLLAALELWQSTIEMYDVDDGICTIYVPSGTVRWPYGRRHRQSEGGMMWTCKHCGRVNPPERLMCRYKDCNPRGGKR